MKAISRLYVMCIVGIAAASINAAAATLWVQGTGAANSYVNTAYSNSSGNNAWSWTTSGSLTSSKTTTRLQAVASNFLGRVDASTSDDNGSAGASESGYAEAYSYWNWTGSPGAATSVGIHTVQSLSKDPTVNYGSVSSVLAFAPSSGTSAGGSAYADIYGNADYWNGSAWTVLDDSDVFTQASADEVVGTRTFDYDLGGQNATITNYHLDNANSFTRAYCDYSISIDHTYSTATGLSTIYGAAEISYDVYCEAHSDGTPPMFGVVPDAVTWARVSINGNVTMDFTL